MVQQAHFSAKCKLTKSKSCWRAWPEGLASQQAPFFSKVQAEKNEVGLCNKHDFQQISRWQHLNRIAQSQPTSSWQNPSRIVQQAQFSATCKLTKSKADCTTRAIFNKVQVDKLLSLTGESGREGWHRNKHNFSAKFKLTKLRFIWDTDCGELCFYTYLRRFLFSLLQFMLNMSKRI